MTLHRLLIVLLLFMLADIDAFAQQQAPYTLEPFRLSLLPAPAFPDSMRPPRDYLEKIPGTQKNNFVLLEKWANKHDPDLRFYYYLPSVLPSQPPWWLFPKTYRNTEVRAQWSAPKCHCIFLIYGDSLLVIDDAGAKPQRAFSITNWKKELGFADTSSSFCRLTWAFMQDSILYLNCQVHNWATYPWDENGFIAAFDMRSNTMLWRTPNSSSNALNFQVFGELIYCSFGITKSVDGGGTTEFLYVLNRKTGVVLQQFPLPARPTMITRHDGVLYIYADGIDCQFRILRTQL